MLSRVADSVYWVSRYIERAENVARFVDVNQSISLGGTHQWSPLIYASGDAELFLKTHGQFTTMNVLKFLLFDKENPNSILSCLISARENARAIREILSVSMWEAINRFYLRVREASNSPELALQNPANFLERVKRFSHEVIGVTEATMSHGDAWNFARIGRLLERADKTSRIVDVKYFILLPDPTHVGSTLDVVQWSALLESTSALHMYRKRFGRIEHQSVAEFLMLDRQFPRSIRSCVTEAEKSLREITGNVNGPPISPVEKEFGELRRRLENVTIQEIMDFGLHEFIDACQQGINDMGEAIRRRFFELRPPTQTQSQSQSQS
jgi:uncharacterized alpha-E superfamily protein